MLRSLVLALLLSACAFAQRDLATITGTVTDPQGGSRTECQSHYRGRRNRSELHRHDQPTAASTFRPAMKPGIYTITAEALASGVQKT